MYSFQKEYDLTAHSPLIHFQYDSSGATLRATEVKPKLDRYILKHCKDIPKEWIRDNVNGKISLDYKLRIIATESKPPFNIGRGTPYDIYYGNMGDNAQIKKGVMNNAKLTVTCFHEDLLEYIDEIIGDFFIVTNFGTMQSKGFGSFTVNQKQDNPNINNSYRHIVKALKSEYTKGGYCYTFRTNEQFAFKNIKTIYSLIKSGLNFTDGTEQGTEEDADSSTKIPYKRSILFDYMHDLPNNIGNEKAWMKQKGISPVLGREKEQDDDISMYVRALLGIGERIEYLKEKPVKGRKVNKEIVSIEEQPDGKTKEEKNENKIERLNSPILFKLIDNVVYFIGCEPNENIYGKTFLFSSTLGKDTLSVPKKEDLPPNFMNQFMHYAFVKLGRCKNKPKFNLNRVEIEEV